MGAGAWVFPFAIGATVIAMGVYFGGHGAEVNTLAGDHVRPGDVVVFDVKEFDAAGHLVVSSDVKRGNLGPSIQGVGYPTLPAVSQAQIPPNVAPGDGSLAGELVGRNSNLTWRTEPHADWYGRWENHKVDLERIAFTMPIRFNLTDDPRTNQALYNFSWLAQNLKAQGAVPAQGQRLLCDSDELWTCTLESVDPTKNTATIKREVAENVAYPASGISDLNNVIFLRGYPLPESPFHAHFLGGNRFEIAWDLKAGDAFILTGDWNGWTRGGYRVAGTEHNRVQVDYMPTSSVGPLPPTDIGLLGLRPPHLVEVPLWREYRILEIHHPTPAA